MEVQINELENKFNEIKSSFENAKSYGDYPTVTETEELIESFEIFISRLNEKLDELYDINKELYGL